MLQKQSSGSKETNTTKAETLQTDSFSRAATSFLPIPRRLLTKEKYERSFKKRTTNLCASAAVWPSTGNISSHDKEGGGGTFSKGFPLRSSFSPSKKKENEAINDNQH